MPAFIGGLSVKILPLLMAMLVVIGSITTSYAKDVTLQWDPNTEPDIAGYKIYYNADTRELPFTGTGAAQGGSPVDVGKVVTASITGLEDGRGYYFAVTAYDSDGYESSFSNIVSLETVPPSVSISVPVANSTVGGPVIFSASASDNEGVARVEFYLGGILVGSSVSQPYTLTYDTVLKDNGSYILTAKAYDFNGNSAESAPVALTIWNDKTPPSVSIASPAAGALVGMNANVTATASDNVGVSAVTFWVDGVMQTTVSTPPFTAALDLSKFASGTHTITLLAYDAAANSAGSAPVTVVVDNTPPTVSVANPVAGTTLSGTVTINVSAGDANGISLLEVYLNGEKKFTIADGSAGFAWNTRLYNNGVYQISAKAYDKAGNSAQSGAVVVTLKNAIKGDVNQDNVVNVSDVLDILRTVVSATAITPEFLEAADVAPFDAASKPLGDGKLNITDVVGVLKRAVGLLAW